MSKPGKKQGLPSTEMAKFTDREDKQQTFRRLLASAEEPPVLVFYGIGGAGKSWLLRRLKDQVPDGIPKVLLDLDKEKGRGYVTNHAEALFEIRQGLGVPAPKFDLAYGVMLQKQGAQPGSNLFVDLGAELAAFGAVHFAAEVVGQAVALPGASALLKTLSKPLQQRLHGTAVESFLSVTDGQKFALDLRRMTAQDISESLMQILAGELRANLPAPLNRAARAVLFFDTFESVGSDNQNQVHRNQYEKWFRDIAAEFDFAFTVIAGQNKLQWDTEDPDWANHMEQHLVGGLADADARDFLAKCEINVQALQDAILVTSREQDGGYHCFSLGLCADIVVSDRLAGRVTEPESLLFKPGEWNQLANRFLKSMPSDEMRRWIKGIAITPRFDEAAARWRFSEGYIVAQDVAWESLAGYSFVEPMANNEGWYTIRQLMRRALENQPSGPDWVAREHVHWRKYWVLRSSSATDECASLAWYHGYCIDPKNALEEWNRLTDGVQTAAPPRMQEHYALLDWWEPTGVTADLPKTPLAAAFLCRIGEELFQGSLGNRTSNLKTAIGHYEAALHVYTEEDSPNDWARTQNNLGNAWSNLPTGNRAVNLERATGHYETALRVYTEEDFPQSWATIRNNIGEAWRNLPTGNPAENFERAVCHFRAALRVFTEKDFPQYWASTRNNLGHTFLCSPTGDRAENLKAAIGHYEAALRVFTEKDFPQYWASTRNNLGNALLFLPTGDRAENLKTAIGHFESALRTYTERDFPQNWALMRYNLGNAWLFLPTGDRAKNLATAISQYEAAVRIYTEQDFPQEWARTLCMLGNTWQDFPTGDRAENLATAISQYEAALRIYTEQDFPQEWARTLCMLGNTWQDFPTDDRAENLKTAIGHYEAALRVRTEDTLPQEWARLQNNLGDAWRDLLSGDRAEN